MKSYNDKLNDILKEQADIPDIVLNKANQAFHEIRQGNVKRTKQAKWQKRSFQTAAASIAALFLIGTTAYAATEHFSLLSKFKDESPSVQKQAAALLETNVTQPSAKNPESVLSPASQEAFASFRVKEAICDKTKIFIALEAKPSDPDKYLLIPSEYAGELDTLDISNLDIQGIKASGVSIREYAKDHGKECVILSVGIPSKADCQTYEYAMDPDGTLCYTISFENVERTKELTFVCNTGVCPPNGSLDTDMIKDSFTFTLDDKTDSETIPYVPETVEKIAGTDLILDGVTFEKSALGMIGSVKYHYAGNHTDWLKTKDGDICFFLYDENGKELTGTEGGTDIGDDGITMTQRWRYSATELPDTLVVKAKDVFEKIEYGEVKVKLQKQ